MESIGFAIGVAVLVLVAVWLGRQFRDDLNRTQWLLVAALGVLLVIAGLLSALPVAIGAIASLAGVTGAVTTRQGA